MKHRLARYIIIIISVVFAIRVSSIFIADRLYSMSMAVESGKITPNKGMNLLNIADKFDSRNANLYFRKYQILDIEEEGLEPEQANKLIKYQLKFLRKCINLCPSWADYHIYYALTLEKMTSNPNIVTRKLILSELEKALELKTHSELYHRIYQKRVIIYK